jgi:hypothetical protein
MGTVKRGATVPDPADCAAAAAREKMSRMDPPTPADPAVRAALAVAMAGGHRVLVVLRGDPARGRPVRTLEGVPAAFASSTDGRERVILTVAQDATEQIVLLERIVRVMAAAVE